MVSMPTSGMQLENAREIFNCVFDALGLTSPEKKHYLAEDSIAGNFRLKGLTVHIVSSEESSDDDESPVGSKFGSVALTLNDLKVLGHLTEYAGVKKRQSLLSMKDHIPKQIKFDISIGVATQIVNIALIRMLMQISETIDFVKEENRFAQKVKSLEVAGPHNMRNEICSNQRKDIAELHKGWATMFNVLQLYADNGFILNDEFLNQETSSEICKFGLSVNIFHNLVSKFMGRRFILSFFEFIILFCLLNYLISSCEIVYCLFVAVGRGDGQLLLMLGLFISVSRSKEPPHVCINLTESPSNSGNIDQEMKQTITKNVSSCTISSIIGTARLEKVRLLAYIGGMNFESEFSNLNSSYFEKVQMLHGRMENGASYRKRLYLLIRYFS